ncbi:hypothetical protein PM3016_3186 [Paenibacillus mucilaginosus 3016]|uniref:CobQ/CobB/MinD/ParA nucleotide binding domain-containing protein n=1 Tax=Paenibacillus mucilaginosus 3016 TaxID=1116391 RepID=H6ND80_9BACL|nr:hypothetical protein [Paenibacillus mucilaginosus]AFC30041.1 hypothetical protein PM3016_3186 [Paenibacillus mucilaginosus 3016]WFA18696.1 hypothetical protein ERY13_16130 [Paenibacillus mucilaginosus]
MGPMTLALLDDDAYFGEMLSAYIRGSAFAERFRLKRFTAGEEGLRYLLEEKEARILLVHESWLPLPEEVFVHPAGAVVILSESAAQGGVLEYPVLCRYQPLDRLMSAVASHYNEYNAALPLRGIRGTRVALVHSAGGGTGKTVTAVHLARRLALRGERVLLLSLERYGSLPWFTDETGGDSETFSRLLYYARMNPAAAAGRLEGLVRRHGYGRFDYVPPAAEPQELEELGAEHASGLVEAVRASGLYDVLIVDTDSYAPALSSALFGPADNILWLVTDDLVHLHKCSRLLRSMQAKETPRASWLSKVRFVLNRSTGAPLNSFEEYGLKIHHRLPYVPEWKAVSRIGQLHRAPAFEDAAGLLLEPVGSGAGL